MIEIFSIKMDITKLNRSNKKECDKDFNTCKRLVTIVRSFENKGRPKELLMEYSNMYTAECNKLSKFYSRFFSINNSAFHDNYVDISDIYEDKGILGKIRKFVNRFDNK